MFLWVLVWFYFYFPISFLMCQVLCSLWSCKERSQTLLTICYKVIFLMRNDLQWVIWLSVFLIYGCSRCTLNFSGTEKISSPNLRFCFYFHVQVVGDGIIYLLLMRWTFKISWRLMMPKYEAVYIWNDAYCILILWLTTLIRLLGS